MMRLRRRDSGLSMIVVVILVLITVILVITAVILHANAQDMARLQKALEAAKESEERRTEELTKKTSDALRPTGFALDGEGVLPTQKAVERAKATRSEYWNASRMAKLPMDMPKDLSDDSKKKFLEAYESSALYATMQEQVALAAAWTFLYKNRFEQVNLEVEAAKVQVQSREKVKPEINQSKEAYKTLLQQRITEVNKHTAEENETYNARKTKLAEDKDKAQKEIDAEAESHAQFQIKIENETRELRRQLEDLKIKEVIVRDISDVHGKVLRPDIPNKMAFIDIGSRERVVTGLKFLVGRRGVQGRFEFKGRIEVKKAWTTYSEVSINEVYEAGERPIVEGDLIINPLFSKERPIVVTFAGEERPVKLRYMVDEATRRIREMGSEVRKDVGLDVDYVIFTEVGPQRARDNYDVFKKAVFLEVPIAEAADKDGKPGIFRFLGD